MGEGVRTKGVNTRPNKHRQLAQKTKSRRKIKSVTKPTRTDRDIYGGKSAELVSALRNQETAWGKENSLIEKARVYNSNGKEVFRNDYGTRNSVSIPFEARYGNVTTHIHPKQKGNDLAARIGLPLSSTDVVNAIAYGAKETRAVGHGYTYSMRPKDGKNWGITPQQFEKEYKKAEREYRKNMITPLKSVYRDAIYANPSKGAYYQRLFTNRVNVAAEDYALKKAAKKLGLVYTRSKR